MRLGVWLAAVGFILVGCGEATVPGEGVRHTRRTFAPVQGPWTTTGGPAGAVTGIIVDPALASTLYVRTGARVLKTTDGGATWTSLKLTTPLVTATPPPVTNSAILRTPTGLYVGGLSRVYRSTDSGVTWTASAELSETVLCSGVAGLNPLAGTGPRPVVARQVLSLAQGASGGVYTLYAGTTSGVFRSTDRGLTWRISGQGLIDPCHQASQQFILHLAADPLAPTTLYAGGLEGAFKTTDGGDNWTPLTAPSSLWGLTSATQGTGNVAVTALALDPTALATLYLATAGTGAVNVSPAAIRIGPSPVTLMVGQTQQLAAIGMDATGIPVSLPSLTWRSSLVSIVSVSSTGLVSALAVGSAGLTATIAGANVQSNSVVVNVIAPVATGPPLTLEVFPESAMIQVGATQQFAVVMKDIAGRTVNRLFLESLSWTTNNTAVLALSSLGLAQGLAPGFATVTVLVSASTGASPGTGGRFSNPSALTVALGQVFRSADGGLTWSRRSNGLPPGVSIGALAIHPNTPTTLYAATSAGVYRSTDAGLTWTATGFQVVSVITITVSQQGEVFAGAAAGLFKSTDGGATWTNLGKGLATTSVTALAANPAVPTTLYAGTDGSGVFVSANGGGFWSPASVGLSQLAVSAVAFDALTGTLYAGTWGSGVFRSTDSAATWTLAGTLHPFVTAIVVDPVLAAVAYAATNGGGVYKTTNGGTTWLLTGLVSVNALSLAFDPTGSTTLYAGTTNGVFKSLDRGLTWTSAGLSNEVVLALTRTGTTLYAGTDGGGVFKTTDGGAAWTAANTGLANLFVFAVAVDPAAPATLYAATEAGVFKSLNGGLTWAVFSDGLTDSLVRVLTFSGPDLYAGTRAGVFKAQ